MTLTHCLRTIIHMRVISGKYRARVLSAPKDGVMPTIDRIKESIFNIISDRIADSHCLDLFGGTGALGIECISRGAKSAVIADNNPQSIKIIKQNLRGDTTAEVFNGDFLDILSKLKNRQFNIIFLDPPYQTDFAIKALERIKKHSMLAPDGIIIWEHPKDTPTKNKFYNAFDLRQYGSVGVTFLN